MDTKQSSPLSAINTHTHTCILARTQSLLVQIWSLTLVSMKMLAHLHYPVNHCVCVCVCLQMWQREKVRFFSFRKRERQFNFTLNSSLVSSQWGGKSDRSVNLNFLAFFIFRVVITRKDRLSRWILWFSEGPPVERAQGQTISVSSTDIRFWFYTQGSVS